MKGKGREQEGREEKGMQGKGREGRELKRIRVITVLPENYTLYLVVLINV